jgi:glycosyltransferase involved in cell wall biosynthesis
MEGSAWATAAIKRRVERAVYHRAGRLIVLSRAFADVLTERYGVDGARIRVVPGGVDTARFAPRLSRRAARFALGLPVDRPTVVSVRRLVRRMGIEDLLAAIRIARTEIPEVLLVVVGTGPLAGDLARQAQAAGLGSQVRFLGAVADESLPNVYRAADLTIVPSAAWEGFGLVVVESLAAGTPALVTAVGGLPATVAGLSDDCVIAERTPAALADAMAGALTGRRRLPNEVACLAHARNRFDWSVVSEQVSAVYREVAQ